MLMTQHVDYSFQIQIHQASMMKHSFVTSFNRLVVSTFASQLRAFGFESLATPATLLKALSIT